MPSGVNKGDENTGDARGKYQIASPTSCKSQQ